MEDKYNLADREHPSYSRSIFKKLNINPSFLSSILPSLTLVSLDAWEFIPKRENTTLKRKEIRKDGAILLLPSF
jgi:hypothetical protein